jgi:hypothetical protein
MIKDLTGLSMSGVYFSVLDIGLAVISNFNQKLSQIEDSTG